MITSLTLDQFNNQELIEDLKEFLTITGNMNPQGYEWDWIIDPITITPKDFHKDYKDYALNNIKEIIIISGYSATCPINLKVIYTDNTEIEYNDIENIDDNINRYHINIILKEFYNKYKALAIQSLESKLQKIKQLPDIIIE